MVPSVDGGSDPPSEQASSSGAVGIDPAAPDPSESKLSEGEPAGSGELSGSELSAVQTELATLDDLPVDRHVEVYHRVHDALTSALASALDDSAGPPSAER